MNATRNNMDNDAVQRLLYGVVEQAVTDVRELRRIGILQGDRVARRWPRRRNGEACHYRQYERTRDVDELMRFLRGEDCSTLLRLAGSQLETCDVCAGLGIGLEARP